MPRITAERREGQRRAILDAAGALFAERGLAHTSMADLAAAAGMSTGAIYRYFAGREEVVAAVAAGRDASVRDGVDPDEPLEHLLARLLQHLRDPTSQDYARITAQVWGEAVVNPALREAVARRHLHLRDHLTRRLVLERGLDERSAAGHAESVLLVLVGVAQLSAVGLPVDPAGVDRLVENLCARP